MFRIICPDESLITISAQAFAPGAPASVKMNFMLAPDAPLSSPVPEPSKILNSATDWSLGDVVVGDESALHVPQVQRDGAVSGAVLSNTCHIARVFGLAHCVDTGTEAVLGSGGDRVAVQEQG